MKIIRSLLLLMAALLLSAPGYALPTLTNVGIYGGTGTVDCRYRFNGRCEWSPVDMNAAYDQIGGAQIGATSGSFAVNDPLRGNASSSGLMSTTSYLPELHAYASSNASYSPDRGNENLQRYTGVWSGVADANIWGVQGYQYYGLTPFDLAITATLESVFSTDGLNGKIGHSTMQVTIFDGAGFVFTYDDAGGCAVWGRICAPGTGPDVSILESNGSILFDSGSVSVVLHHTVMPGDVFYVGAGLDASVCCGATVDSSHTLKLAFNDPSQLSSVALRGVVPEPSTLPLQLIGLVLLVFGTRRRAREPNVKRDAPAQIRTCSTTAYGSCQRS